MDFVNVRHDPDPVYIAPAWLPKTGGNRPTNGPGAQSIVTIDVNGDHFEPEDRVFWNGVAVPTQFISEQVLRATVDQAELATARVVPVKVVTNEDVASASIDFIITDSGPPQPVITSFSPASIAATEEPFELTINGSGFTSDAMVQIDLTDGTTDPQVRQVSSTQLVATMTGRHRRSVGNKPVTVRNGVGGPLSAAVDFPITSPALVTAAITAIQPTAATVNSPALDVRITGTNFLSALNTPMEVRFNGQVLMTGVVNGTEITATIPASLLQTAGAFPITVTNYGAPASNAATFTVDSGAPAVLTSMFPAAAPAGSGATHVVITGANIRPGAVVQWNSSSRTTQYSIGTFGAQIEADLPATDLSTAGTGTITVLNTGSTASNALTFTVEGAAQPAVSTIDPPAWDAGGGAFTITVRGALFNTSAALYWNGSPRVTTVASAAQLTAQIIAADVATPGVATVTIVNPGNLSSIPYRFQICGVSGCPSITDLLPLSRARGGATSTLTVKGTGFGSGSTVHWDSLNLPTTFVDAQTLTATVDASLLTETKTVRITVTTADGSPSNERTLAVQPLFRPEDLRLGTVTNTSVQLQWNDILDNETAFQIAWTPWGSTTYTYVDLSANVLTWTHSGLAAGSTYHYWVRACHLSACSDWSLGVTGLTTGGTPPPPPTNVTVGTETASTIPLSWTDQAGNETSYEVVWNRFQTPGYLLQTLPANTTSWTHSEETPGTPLLGGWTYFYWVRACINGALCSAWVGAVTGITLPHTLPVNPTNLQVGAVTSTSIQMTWADNATTETHYLVAWTPTATPDYHIETLAANAITWTHSGLGSGQSYYYWVAACRGALCSDWAGAVQGTTANGLRPARSTGPRLGGGAPIPPPPAALALATITPPPPTGVSLLRPPAPPATAPTPNPSPTPTPTPTVSPTTTLSPTATSTPGVPTQTPGRGSSTPTAPGITVTPSATATLARGQGVPSPTATATPTLAPAQRSPVRR